MRNLSVCFGLVIDFYDNFYMLYVLLIILKIRGFIIGLILFFDNLFLTYIYIGVFVNRVIMIIYAVMISKLIV